MKRSMLGVLLCLTILLTNRPVLPTSAATPLSTARTVDLNTRGDVLDVAWDRRIDLLDAPYTNYPAGSDCDGSNVKVCQNADGSVTYGNTKGQWPAAGYTFAEPILMNDTAALDIDFTVSTDCRTTIYLFMGEASGYGSTPDNFGNGTYLWIADFTDPAQVVQEAELEVGHYSGIVFLEDIYKKTVKTLSKAEYLKNADGEFVINGLKIHAISDAAVDNAVTVQKLDLVSVDYIPGDVTGDGDIKMADATRLFYYVNGMIELREGERFAADVTADGKIGLADAVRVFYLVSGLL